MEFQCIEGKKKTTTQLLSSIEIKAYAIKPKANPSCILIILFLTKAWINITVQQNAPKKEKSNYTCESTAPKQSGLFFFCRAPMLPVIQSWKFFTKIQLYYADILMRTRQCKSILHAINCCSSLFQTPQSLSPYLNCPSQTSFSCVRHAVCQMLSVQCHMHLKESLPQKNSNSLHQFHSLSHSTRFS